MTSAMPDVIVVIPGIMGSTLVAPDGKELWGVKPGTLLRSIRQLGSNFEKLRLLHGIGDSPASDGVKAGKLIPIPHVVGKLLGSDGYGNLIAWLEKTFAVQQPKAGVAGNLIPFPYDWRLSNRFTAKRMEAELVPHLEQWRKESNNPEAKFRFICHSMGGLVARWFTEVLGGRELTRQVITIGTPHRGAAAALLSLSNGFGLKLGPVGVSLTEILRSLPSAHQLLPTYLCVDTADGLKRIGDVAIPDVEEMMVNDALAFHASILEHAQTQQPKEYEKFALKGIAQPTTSSARFRNGRLEPLNTLDGKDWSGDGTVPRISSHMPELKDDATAAVFGQQHSTLQSDGNLHRQLFAILTASEVEKYADAERLLGLDLPEVLRAGEPLAITVTSASGDASLPLRAEVFGEDDSEINSSLMRNLGEGRYRVQFDDIPPGQVKVRIGNATPDVPLDPVTGVMIVWDPALDRDNA